MARFNAAEAENYGGSGGAGFFQLKNDKETARVRFLYNTVEDIQGESVHEVAVNDKKRYVSCLRNYRDPMDACPFCREKMFTQAKLFIPVYNIKEDKVQIWERGKTFFSKMTSVCSRAENPSIVAHIFEVERNGKPHDQKTSYEIYDIEKDDTILEDFEAPNIVGPKGFVLEKTDDDEEDEVPVRRRGSREDRSSERRTGRRTPADSDRF